MKVMDGLLRILAAIDDTAISRLLDALLGSDTSGRETQTSKQVGVRRVGVRKTADVTARNDKNVDRRFGIDIAKGQDVFILVNNIRENVPQGDFAKEAINHESVYDREPPASVETGVRR